MLSGSALFIFFSSLCAILWQTKPVGDLVRARVSDQPGLGLRLLRVAPAGGGSGRPRGAPLSIAGRNLRVGRDSEQAGICREFDSDVVSNAASEKEGKGEGE